MHCTIEEFEEYLGEGLILKVNKPNHIGFTLKEVPTILDLIALEEGLPYTVMFVDNKNIALRKTVGLFG